MKMIGMSLRSAATRFCRSRPLRSGSETSSTRQLGTNGRGWAMNSSADANVSGCQPAQRISDSSDSRTEMSSSTTNTMGVACAMADDRGTLSDALADLICIPQCATTWQIAHLPSEIGLGQVHRRCGRARPLCRSLHHGRRDASMRHSTGERRSYFGVGLRPVSAAACLHQAISIVPLYLPWFRGGSQSLPKFGADGYPHWTCRVGVGHGRRPPWLRLHYPRHVLAGDGARTLAAEPCIFGWIWPVFGATAAVSTVIASPSLRRVTARNLSGRRLEALLVLRLTARRRRATRGRR